MKVSVKILITAIFFSTLALNGLAQKTNKAEQKTKAQPKTVVSIIEKNPQTTSFYNYLKRDNLTQELNSDKIYTIFAPANSVFNPPATQDSGMTTSVMKPEVPANWANGFIVEGAWDVNAIVEKIKANNWKAEIVTRSGSTLWATLENGAVKLTDDKGNSARIVKYNYMASNGVVHIIEGQLPMDSPMAPVTPAATSGK